LRASATLGLDWFRISNPERVASAGKDDRTAAMPQSLAAAEFSKTVFRMGSDTCWRAIKLLKTNATSGTERMEVFSNPFRVADSLTNRAPRVALARNSGLNDPIPLGFRRSRRLLRV